MIKRISVFFLLLYSGLWCLQQGNAAGWLPLVKSSAGCTDPSCTSNLYTWLKADANIFTNSGCTTPATNDGDAIGCWKDNSAGARNYTNGTQTAVLKLNILNTKPIIRFDATANAGLGQFLAGPTAAALTAGEIFLVVKANADPGAAVAGAGLYNFGAADDDTLYPYFGDSSVYDDFGTTARKSTGNPTPSLASFRLYNVVSASGEWTSFIDGTQFFTTATNTVSFSATPFVGKTLPDNYPFTGDIAEVIIYSAKASGGDKTIVKNYIASKYGLTIASLPNRNMFAGVIR